MDDVLAHVIKFVNDLLHVRFSQDTLFFSINQTDHHDDKGVRAKNNWLGVKMMYPSRTHVLLGLVDSVS